VVTALTGQGPVGLSVGSFTSVSLNPPLVGFLPAVTSSSWPLIQRAGAFCVNILAAGQEELAGSFASPSADRFAGRSWRPAPWSGAPIFDGVVAWVDCEVAGVSEAGDHHFVLGKVSELGISTGAEPLVFFRGNYRELS
jgi:flavin reductase (DIM6/NTAB) family NADH-FMN oxidoreductase RutF